MSRLSWFQPILNLVVSGRCALCKRTAAIAFCQDCERQLHQCQLDAPHACWQGELPMLAWGRYEGTLKRAIATLKYENHPELAQPLGRLAASPWQRVPKQTGAAARRKLLVVPIPIHAEKRQQRGFNQAELLAAAFCRATGLPLATQGLQRIKATTAQFGLSVSAREHNMTGAFAVGPTFKRPMRNTEILLFDDIYTTGSTARAAATTLRQEGLTVAGIVAIAKAF
ncbi:ComF family protein [Leptolyngbya sp. AN02str]|uniref:ComF family protein n=1 Tax=Leptolyngbya sp. AN02str TaxID=3423363 RepID=UPI003D31832C